MLTNQITTKLQTNQPTNQPKKQASNHPRNQETSKQTKPNQLHNQTFGGGKTLRINAKTQTTFFSMKQWEILPNNSMSYHYISVSVCFYYHDTRQLNKAAAPRQVCCRKELFIVLSFCAGCNYICHHSDQKGIMAQLSCRVFPPLHSEG